MECGKEKMLLNRYSLMSKFFFHIKFTKSYLDKSTFIDCYVTYETTRFYQVYKK